MLLRVWKQVPCSKAPNAINQMSAPRDKAITALLKLQALGITDDEILNVYEFLIRARFESAATIRR